ncbi:acyltransferase family protein [Humidesulfovibrio sp.]|uniref:acyltransferase family protein n=1 Tax=Humidesulfovibrio sp. TaxID=2910988 RepID=UPI0035BE4EC7
MAYNDQSPGEIDPLLILRGLASLGVLFVHSLNFGSDKILKLPQILNTDYDLPTFVKQLILSTYPTTGGNFVMCFFVLSGYLMGKVFLSSSTPVSIATTMKFYKRRFLRIAPLYYFNIFLCLALTSSSSPFSLATIGEVLFINNITGAAINPVTWSLSYEMQYYIIAPLVYIMFRKRSLFTVLCIIATSAAFSTLLFVDKNNFLWIARFIFVFLTGYSVNILLRLYHPHKNRVANVIGFSLFFLGNAFYYHLRNSGQEFQAQISLTLIMAVCLWILELPSHTSSYTNKGTQHVFLRFWNWMGVLSYGVYLWHLPILNAQHPKLLSLCLHLRDQGWATSDWQFFFLYQSVQLFIILSFTVTLSLFTFLFVELKYRPNLYSAQSGSVSSRIINALTLSKS